MSKTDLSLRQLVRMAGNAGRDTSTGYSVTAIEDHNIEMVDDETQYQSR